MLFSLSILQGYENPSSTYEEREFFDKGEVRTLALSRGQMAHTKPDRSFGLVCLYHSATGPLVVVGIGFALFI